MKIKVFENPFSPVAPLVAEAENLAVWLLQHYGETPQFGLQIFVGEPSAESEITNDAAAIIRSDQPEYTILQSPGLPAAVIPFLINAAIGLALSFAMQLLFPPEKQSMPSNVNRTQESPNNALGARENQVRMLQRVEDIYGTVKAVPSLMMPTYNKYIQHQRVEYGYYCVGRGYYDISAVQDGDTLISAVNGASAAVYNPFSSPNTGGPFLQIGDPIIDRIMTVRRSVEIDGLALLAQNQINVASPATYVFAEDIPGVANPQIRQIDKIPNLNSVAEVGQTISVSMGDALVENFAAETASINFFYGANPRYVDESVATPQLFAGVNVGSVVTIEGYLAPGNNGTFTVIAKPSAREIEVALTTQSGEFATAGVTLKYPVNYSGTYTIIEVGDGFVGVAGTPFRSVTLPASAYVTVNNGEYDWTNWVTLAGTARTEVWVNVVAAQGLYKDSGGRSPATVWYQLQIEQLNGALVPTGWVETINSALSGKEADERAETLEHTTGWVGPARVRMRRTTPFDYGFSGLVVDEIKWTDLYAVTPVTKAHFGNKTTIHTITKATPRATAARQRQLNCIATRKLPILVDSTPPGGVFSGTFNAAGQLVSGAIYGTSKIVDIIAAVAADPMIGGRNLAIDVDLGQIAATQAQLDAWNPAAGQFNYTLDSDSLSFEETVTTIANAAFCVAYRQSNKIRLAFDRAQPSSTAMFTHRNKKPASETITRKFATDAEYDGVEFVYQDPDSQQAETIKLPLDGSALKYKKFEIPGIRNFAQAWYRANREYRKLIGQRMSIETDATTDARSLLPNARVDIVDNTRFKSYDGEVVGQSGLMLTLSRDVAFTPSVGHSIILMRRDGSLQGIVCTAGLNPNQVILAGAPSEAIVTQGGQDGIRTIFSFAADSARGAQAWLVQEIGMSDGQYIRIRAVNYSADYYAADLAPVPPKDSIIN